MLILGYGAKARQGKDTAGEAVADYYKRKREIFERNYNVKIQGQPAVQIFKFAEALYEECRKYHGMTEKDAPLLQRVGQERRQENQNYWVDKVFQKIKEVNPEIAIITDVRYKNEAFAIRAQGGYLINVSRRNHSGEFYIADDRPADHPSEIDLDDYPWDFRISARTGEAALVGDLAITIAEYIKGLHE